jgi:hypothetical protein
VSGPGAGAALGAAIVSAVSAAQAQDPERFEQLSADLRGPMVQHVDTVLAAVVRDLLEVQHPDGLAGEDIVDVLAQCAQDAMWRPDIEARTLLVVLLGALGVAEPVPADDGPAGGVGEHSQDSLDEPPIVDPPTGAALRRHALLLVASLCSATGEPAIRPVRSAIAEIHRAQTQEMP